MVLSIGGSFFFSPQKTNERARFDTTEERTPITSLSSLKLTALSPCYSYHGHLYRNS
jgi:hypothetical protein